MYDRLHALFTLDANKGNCETKLSVIKISAFLPCCLVRKYRDMYICIMRHNMVHFY